MFKQITNLEGNEWYLITSLWIFLLFFIIVTLLIIRMRKQHSSYMSRLPLKDEEEKELLDSKK
jgi:cbb3-type cytochrome oxidase subunit 3